MGIMELAQVSGIKIQTSAADMDEHGSCRSQL
jgi:hypothetical protein